MPGRERKKGAFVFFGGRPSNLYSKKKYEIIYFSYSINVILNVGRCQVCY